MVILSGVSQNTVTAWGVEISVRSVAMISVLTAPAKVRIAATPCLNLHHNHSLADFAARIIHTEAQNLEVMSSSGGLFSASMAVSG